MTNESHQGPQIYRRDALAKELGVPQTEENNEPVEGQLIDPTPMNEAKPDQSVPMVSQAETEKTPDQDTDYNPDFNPLNQYAVNKHFEDREGQFDVKKYLGGMVAEGEITLIFAAAGVGKTLCTLGLMADDIAANRLNPRYVGYINKDDSGQGIREKVHLANELGFHMISDAHRRHFGVAELIEMTRKLVGLGVAPQSLIVIDTVKKFHDVNDKKSTVGFYKALRPFTMAGGTVVGLAHTNKFTDVGGQSVYAGTADNVQDVDAAYVGDVIVKASTDSSLHVVRLTQIKGRLASTEPLHFGFAAGGDLSWGQRLKTLHLLAPDDLVRHQQKHDRKIDDEVISAIVDVLRSGFSTPKMELVKAVADATVRSRRDILAVLDKYTGPDPKRHLWNFEKGQRGAKKYDLHEHLH